MGREFRISREVTLPATAEQVWQALATGEGQAGWLWPTHIEPGVGGKADMGEVTAWDPPRHLGLRAEGPDGWFNALEMLVEAQDGGTAVLRYVHSGIFTDNWDNQYDGAENNTDFYLHTLGQYLRFFTGRAAAYVTAQGPDASRAPAAFLTLKGALCLGETPGVGDPVRIAVEGLDPVEGHLDYVRPQFLGIRTADGLYRFFGRNAWGAPVGLSHHLFAGGLDQDKTQLAWQAWLDDVYA